MATSLYYPPTQNGLQKQLDAQLDEAATASMTLNNVTGIQNKPGVCVINRIDADGVLQSASVREYVSYTAISGSTLTGLTRGLGGSTDQDHAIGSIVEFIPDVVWAQAIISKLDGTDTVALEDTNGNEMLKTSTTASAVNEITVKNAATGTGPELQATGGDTNIDLELSPKGTGGVLVNGTATTAAYIKLAEDTDNGTNYIAIKAPAAVTSDTTLTLPDGAGTSGYFLSTNGSGTLSWAQATGSTTGWITPSETWTRTGNYTFTVPTDLTAQYTKGTKIRYKDGGSFEYGYVESSSYGAPNTTVTLVTNADYTMAAATITEPGYSYAENPQGFPEWFTFTTTFAGFSADPSTTTIYFKLSGLMCTFYYIDGSDGTSNATSLTFTMPVAAARSSNQAGIITIKDNSSISSTPGHLTTSASSKTFAAYKTFSQGAWTGSGAKNIFIPELSYRWT